MKSKTFFVSIFFIFLLSAYCHALTIWTKVTPSWTEDTIGIFSAAVFNGRLYAATQSQYGSQVWYYDGTSWSNISHPLFSVLSMAVFNGYLCIEGFYFAGDGTSHEQVWSYDGTTWSNRTPWWYWDGGSGCTVKGIDSMTIFSGSLFVGTEESCSCGGRSNIVGRVWSYNGATWSYNTPWNNCDYRDVSSMTVFNNSLYVAPFKSGHGSDIWVYDGTYWSKVAGPPSWPINPRGVSNMTVFNSRLYAATYVGSIGEVWSSDGTTWVNITPPWDPYVGGATSMAAFNNRLYVTTENEGPNPTAEMWSYDGTIWVKETIPWETNDYRASILAVFNDSLFVTTENFSGAAQVWSLSTCSSSLDPPSLISPATGEANIVLTPTLYWGDISGSTSYDVQVCSDSSCSSVVRSANVTNSQWTVSPALTSGTYYWQVRAKNTCGWSLWSEVWWFSTANCTTPIKPVLSLPLNGATSVSTSPTLNWGDVSGATSYDVQVCSGPGCSDVVSSANVTDSQWTVSPTLSPNTTYYWRVRARNSCEYGPWSNVWSFTTICTPPSKPSLNLPANNATGVSITPTLDWDDVSGASLYMVQLCIDSNCHILVRRGITRNSQWAARVLIPGRTYYWRVRARNSCGSSPFSDIWKFQTAP
jgi:hypothetical protein